METSHYARLVQRARSERLAVGGETIDWVLVRNRISMLASRNTRQVHATLEAISTRFACRLADGIAERVIFRSCALSAWSRALAFSPAFPRSSERVTTSI